MRLQTLPLGWIAGFLGCLLASSALAQTAEDVVFKHAEAAELNLARDQLALDTDERIDPGPVSAELILGDPPHKNSVGEGTRASSFANDGGTFWVEIIADNNGLPNDNGSGSAETALEYLMRKDSETESPVLHVSGGQLALTDFGGGAHPLLAQVSMTTTVWDVSDEAFASISGSTVTLSGRGGTAASETFDYVFEADALGRNFLVTDADYHEFETPIGSGVNVYDALLDIPAQEVPIDISTVCLGCEFYLNINLSGLAENPGGESAARAYFRDPLHVGGADPNQGAAFLELSGVTVLPWKPRDVPEPWGLGLVAVALPPLLTKRSITRHTARRWFARASSIRRKSTKRC